jgi:hypothetical protein
VSRRLLVAVVTAGFLSSVLAAAPASQAESSTICIGRSEILQIAPGLSRNPTTGTGITTANGSEECSGSVEGHQPTGTISTRHDMVYGYLDPDTCSGQEYKGWVDHSIPTAGGVVVIRNHFTATFEPSSDPPVTSGTFQGERLSGRFWLRPLEGDCVTTPLTRIEVGWIGIWHGKGRS